MEDKSKEGREGGRVEVSDRERSTWTLRSTIFFTTAENWICVFKCTCTCVYTVPFYAENPVVPVPLSPVLHHLLQQPLLRQLASDYHSYLQEECG